MGFIKLILIGLVVSYFWRGLNSFYRRNQEPMLERKNKVPQRSA